MTETVTIQVPSNAEILINGKPYKAPVKTGKPEKGDTYWIWDQHKSLADDMEWADDHIDNGTYDMGLLFHTKEACELDYERRKLTRKFKDLVAELNAREGFVVDFSDKDYHGYTFLYDHREEQIKSYGTGATQEQESSMIFHLNAEAELRKQFTDSDIKLILIGER